MVIFKRGSASSVGGEKGWREKKGEKGDIGQQRGKGVGKKEST